MALKLIFNVPRCLTAAILKIEKLQYFMMTQNGSLKHVGRPPPWINKIKSLTGDALAKHILHHRAKFCGDTSYRYRDIAIFRVFLVKCENSKDDCA